MKGEWGTMWVEGEYQQRVTQGPQGTQGTQADNREGNG